MTDNADFKFYHRMGLYAAAAAWADMCTFPLDVAKVRLQIQQGTGDVANMKYKSLTHTVATIIKEEGFLALYNGLSPGIQRQVCFTAVKFGLYESVKQFYLNLLYDDPVANKMNIPVRIAAGLTTGCMAVCLAQPTDVVKIRFQAGQKGGVKYKSSLEAYPKIFKAEGLAGLWKGTIPNCLRNGFINVGEIVVYDTVKEAFLTHKIMSDNIYCHFVTGIIAGFCATVIASPIDVIKTRYMNSPKGMYKGSGDVALQTLKEGPLAFYKGFVPSFARIATWNVITWITFEQLKILARKALGPVPPKEEPPKTPPKK